MFLSQLTSICFSAFLIIRNIVSTVNLGCKLDLKTIALRARNAEYNPKVRLPYVIDPLFVALQLKNVMQEKLWFIST